ncbi:MAG TPA: glycosyltransferase [Bacillota bacterium]|nr:glycosyltransferase [Bacillota bacterium]
MRISALIAIKKDKGWRDSIWSKVLQRYEQLMPDLELCVVYDESNPFWKTRALNKAAQQATGDILMTVDADVVFRPNLLKEIAAVALKYPWVIPFTKGIRLNKSATQRLLQKALPKDLKVIKSDIQVVDPTPGILINVMKHSSYDAIGGFDERFRGWGHEDTAFVIALNTICGKPYHIPGNVYHLWHPHASKAQFKANERLLGEYLAAKGSLIKMKQLIKDR